MNINIVNSAGGAVKDLKISDDLLIGSPKVVHSVVKAYRASRRQGTHATKTRAMVSGGGKKPIKQKGTGGARQGSSRSPLMPGGGVAHGPQPRSYTEKINHKVKSVALKSALKDRFDNNKIYVIDNFNCLEPKTKKILEIFKALKIEPGHSGDRKTVLLSDLQSSNNFLYLSAKNIKGVSVISPTLVNAEDILKHELLLISEKAWSKLEQRLAGSKAE